MSLSIPYESIGDAQMRLNSTVVLYDGEPVYIREIGVRDAGDPKDDVFRVYAETLPRTGREKVDTMRKYISSKKFDMAPFPMGFMNHKGYAYYCSRLPRRQQKQGLSENTFSCCPVAFQHEVGSVSFGTATQLQPFVDMVKGRYPTMEEALRLLSSEEAKSVGFSRTYALIRDLELDGLIYLYHKQEKVGFILDGALKLSKSAVCLKESLREVGIPC